ncbi:ATP-grasp domain-containing protein [Pacificispira sp.]|uniref:ATP-grasp domain-containing protein n=1 Tax=Pacificispira sp. TaxID=2888761 RepID=UPI003BA8E712
MTRAGRHGLIVVDRSDHGSSVVLDDTVRRGVADMMDGTDLAGSDDRRFGAKDRVVITSENVLDTVLQRLDDPARADLIDALKNKHRCREMLTARYPDFYYGIVQLDRLTDLKLPPGRRFVVKPNRGYFATAIKIVDSDSDLAATRDEMAAEIRKNGAVFASTVLSDADVIVEEFIDGEEYAVDMFYDGAGMPVIVNIYHHPIPENPDYLHALYYTSKPVFDRLHGELTEWFSSLNETLGARAFPIHGEFKLGANGLVPVELNPLRFGGDGLIDLAFHAFGLNPYDAFFNDRAPDWPTIWRGREEKIYTWMMGYVGTDVDVSSHRPDHGAFQNLFSNILSDTLLNYEAHLGFSVVYAEESDIEAVHRLVNTDFQKFFRETTAFSEDALAKLYRNGVRLQIAAGDYVWHEGDVGDFVLLVIEGGLDVMHRNAQGQEVYLDTIGQRSVVGEYAVIDGRPRTAGVRGGRDGCTAMKVSGEAFRKLLRDAPGLFEELYWQQQMRIRKMNARIGDLEAELAALRAGG